MKLDDLRFKPGTYLAFLLSEKSRADLLTRWPPLYPDVRCHHVTLEFNLTDEKLAFFMRALKGGADVQVVGYAKSDKLDLFAVTLNGQAVRPDGGYYHITHSLVPPTKPKESNDLLTRLKGETDKFRGTWKLDGEVILLKK